MWLSTVQSWSYSKQELYSCKEVSKKKDFKHSYSLAIHTIILHVIYVVEVGGAQGISIYLLSYWNK